jgi:hypothetical protein
VWLVVELCTGGTLKDAVSMGKLRAQGRLEMVSALFCFVTTVVTFTAPSLLEAEQLVALVQ